MEGLILGWLVGLPVGGFAGYAAAVISDAGLAYETPPAEKVAATPSQSTWSVAPKFAVSPKGGIELGVGGAF